MELYASWGVDFIKVDDIAYSTIYRDSHRKEIEGIRKAIDKTGRRLYFPFHRDRQDFRMEAFSKRMPICGDLQTISGMSGNCSMICSIVVRYWSPFIRKGNWPDCDMLPLGHIGIRSGERGKADRMTCFLRNRNKRQ